MPTYNKPHKVDLPPEYDNKAKNIYSRMSIYFDLHIYDDPSVRDDDLLFRYLYLIIYMLACKEYSKHFHSFEEYDEFSWFMATRLYLRYINPEHTSKYGHIVSVLNYCKSLMYHTIVDWQRETFNQIYGVDKSGKDDGLGFTLKSNMVDSIQTSYCSERNINESILDEFKYLPKCIWKVVNETPYKKDKLMIHRLYMSTLISTINSLTLSNETIMKLENKSKINDEVIYQQYEKERNNCVILWRLDSKYTNLVELLVRKSRIKFSEKLHEVRQDLELNEEDLNAVIMSAYGNTYRNDNEEF